MYAVIYIDFTIFVDFTVNIEFISFASFKKKLKSVKLLTAFSSIS